MKKDVIVPLVCLAGALFLYYSLNWIDDERAQAFPRVVIIIIGVLSLLLLLQTLALKQVRQASAGNPFPWVRFLIMFVLIVVYFAIMERVGFYLSAFLFFVAVTSLFGKSLKNAAKACARVVLPMVFTSVLYLLFNVLLKVQTPKGLLF